MSILENHSGRLYFLLGFFNVFTMEGHVIVVGLGYVGLPTALVFAFEISM